MTYVKLFSEISHDDNEIVGGKASSLSELYALEVNVPAGFAVTTNAYTDFLRKHNLEERIQERLKGLDGTDLNQLRSAEAYLRSLHQKPVPRDISEPVLKAYDEIGDGLVAVRSSATAEDMPGASFAGQYRSFLNVSKRNLISSLKECWKSLYTSRSIAYRLNRKIKNAKMAVVVQKMINAEKSGVMFTHDPSSEGMRIDFVVGLGETYVSGRESPMGSYSIKDEHINVVAQLEPTIPWSEMMFYVQRGNWGQQKFMLTRNSKGNVVKRRTPDEFSELAREQIIFLVNSGRLIEDHYQMPMDVEFASDDSGKIHILQARPVTAKI